MTGKSFELNETTLPVIEELGRHMPGGFFIDRAEAPEELLYANKACFDIFGCNGPEDFKALNGYTFNYHSARDLMFSFSISAQDCSSKQK